MDPATMTALATVASSALQGAGSMFGGGAQAKAAKKEAKEMKRQTLADILNKALGRELDLYKFTKEQESGMTKSKMAALQEAANGFTRALTGR